jgi:hypothetical protein
MMPEQSLLCFRLHFVDQCRKGRKIHRPLWFLNTLTYSVIVLSGLPRNWLSVRFPNAGPVSSRRGSASLDALDVSAFHTGQSVLIFTPSAQADYGDKRLPQ